MHQGITQSDHINSHPSVVLMFAQVGL